MSELGINNRKILFFFTALVVLVLSVFAILKCFYHDSQNDLNASRPADEKRQQIEFESGRLVENLRQAQSKKLNSYLWKDSQEDVAEVPIDRAVQIYLKKQEEK